MSEKLRREEFPNPREQRGTWQTLNGYWDFRFGEEDAYTRKINVPYAYQCELSGIHDTTVHKEVWYRREIELNEGLQASKRIRLRFLACDYQTTVWVNGKYATSHTGGYGAFDVDITDYLNASSMQTIELKVYDDLSEDVPRGKQYWKAKPEGCWYYQTTGIWQSVWLEGYGEDYITSIKIKPDVDKTSAEFSMELADGVADEVCVHVTSPFGATYDFSCAVKNRRRIKLATNYDKPVLFFDDHLWAPEHPHLYWTNVVLKKEGEVVDEIKTYFAFRKIHTANGQIYLNDVPVTFKLILDQGYWKDGGMTPPSCESLKEDILIAKQYGFNGARKHQKVEDPYFYYYADILGFFVWAETPSAYIYNARSVAEIMQMQSEIIDKVYNNPSVVAYVPLNESWGVKEILHNQDQQNFARSLYYLCKSLDGSRLVVTNDGWENVETTDIVGCHDYAPYGENFTRDYVDIKDYSCPAGRRIMVEGDSIGDKPVMLSEFGGIAISTEDSGWGYGKSETSKKDFLDRLKTVMEQVKQTDVVGWCYTQLTDVEQEINGLLDVEHKPKFSLEEIKNIFL